MINLHKSLKRAELCVNESSIHLDSLKQRIKIHEQNLDIEDNMLPEYWAMYEMAVAAHNANDRTMTLIFKCQYELKKMKGNG